MNSKAPPQRPIWLAINHGPSSGAINMATDQSALDDMVAGLNATPLVRFFQWDVPTISYGYLLDEARVRMWAKENGGLPVVKRPTGGGAVIHQPSDLSLSLLWPRHSNLLPNRPRDCYEKIHDALKEGLSRHVASPDLQLHQKNSGTCDVEEPAAVSPAGRFSVCYQEPVCNDVMRAGKKIIGGALRMTKGAILYQGHIQMEGLKVTEELKIRLFDELTRHSRGSGNPGFQQV
jgi:lipoate-protein ligase A